MENKEKKFHLNKKIVFGVASIIFNYVVPVVFLLFQFDFFKKTNAPVKLSAIGLSIILILTIKFYKQINEWVKKIENKNFLIAITIAKSLIFSVISTLLIYLMKDKLADLQVLILTFCISWGIGNSFHYLRLKEIDKTKKRKKDDDLRSIIREELERAE